MSAALFMADAYTNDVTFYLEGEAVQMLAPASIWEDEEVMQLLLANKPAIQKQLKTGFDCVRDGLSIAEIKMLTAAAQQGKNVSVVRLVA